MLAELGIRNFAIIDELNIEFQEGFNVLTGETGAGKSIIIDAVNLILGSRANKETVKNNAEKAIIDARFEINQLDPVKNKVKEYGIDLDNTLILTREIYANGKNNVRINGRIATINMLKELASYLIDIHGQQENHTLSEKVKHMELLDRYAGAEVQEKLQGVQAKYKEIKELKESMNEFQINDEEKNRLIDIYKYQMEEIELAELIEGEEEELTKYYKKMAHQEDLKEAVEKAVYLLSNEELGVLSQLQKAVRELSHSEKYEPKVIPIKEALQNYQYCIKDMQRELDGLSESVFVDDEDFFRVEKRIEQINNLKRKYGKSIMEIIDYFNEIQSKYDKLVEYDKLKQHTLAEIEKKEAEMLILCSELHDIRQKHAKLFEVEMQTHLSELNFAKSDFYVVFNQKDYYTEMGADDIEFYICTNIGEEARPLIKVASGGEMSRIMLAFKTIIAEIDEKPTLIFDEIDTGISGRTAQVVAEKIMKVSRGHQVICISHLPQIAVMGDIHHSVTKEVSELSTRVVAKTLNEEERIDEISRLVGGVDLNENTRQYARELLQEASDMKKMNGLNIKQDVRQSD